MPKINLCAISAEKDRIFMTMEKIVELLSPKKDLIMESIRYNNRFGNRQLNAEQIGAETFDAWKAFSDSVQKSVYNAFKDAYNNVETMPDLSAFCPTMSQLYNIIGEVNGFKLSNNNNTALAVVAMVQKSTLEKSEDLSYAEEVLRNRRKELEKAEDTKGVNPQFIANIKKDIADYEAIVKTLKETPDKCTRTIKTASPTRFRAELESYVAKKIEGQLLKSYEELQAEAEARRVARREATKAKKAAEKLETPKTEISAAVA